MLTPHAIGIEVGRLGKVWVFDGLERRDALGRVVVEETLDEIQGVLALGLPQHLDLVFK